MKKRQLNKTTIESLFPGGTWTQEGTRYEVESPLRDDKNNGGAFVIFWPEGNFFDSAAVKKEHEKGSFRQLLILSGKAKDKKEVDKILLGKEIKRKIYSYTDKENNELFQVVRVDYEFGKKFYQRHKKEDGKYTKGVPEDLKKRPLYLLPALIDHKGIVILVEGEKCADVANRYFLDNNRQDKYIVTTWPMGAGSISITDFSPLKGKKLILWPDNDDAGIKAMKDIALNFPGCLLVDTSELEEKEDIADVIESGKKIWAFLKNAVPQEIDNTFVAKMPSKLWYKPDTYTTKNGAFRVLDTVENFQALLSFYDIELKENLMSHDVEFFYKGKKDSSEGKRNNAFLNQLTTLCNRNSFRVGSIGGHVVQIAHQNSYHPAKEFIESKEWDGENRIEKLYGLLHLEEKFYKLLLKKWLLSCVAVLYEPLPFYRGVLVLQGPQSIGKTTFLMSLFPSDCFYEGLTLDPKNKDSIEIAISHWVCELGELGATFRKSDKEQLKSFLTKRKDSIRFAYERRKEDYPRRTVFCGTVNELKFLSDETGSSRFWVIPVEKIEYLHNVNIQQLWAQVKNIYDSAKLEKKENIWWLSPEQEKILLQMLQQHEQIDVMQELLFATYPAQDEMLNPKTISNLPLKTATEICRDMLKRTPKRQEVNRLHDIILKHDYFKTGYENRNKKYHVPEMRDVFDSPNIKDIDQEKKKMEA